MIQEEFDWVYYQEFNEDIRNGEHFDNNYTCWSILKKTHDDSPLRKEIDDLRKLLCKNHEVAPKTFIDIILYIEYLEWKLYILDVRRFMRLGITFGTFNTETLINELRIERFQRRFETLQFSNHCYPDMMLDSKEDASFVLTYNLDFEKFSFLDVSIATGISDYIKHAINIGSNRCVENSYSIPELVRMPIQETYSRCFMGNDIVHGRIYHHYKSVMKEMAETNRYNNVSNKNGIQNILTGGTVRQNDGTYYIDDFR